MSRNPNPSANELAPIVADDIFQDPALLSPRQVVALEKVTKANLERLVEEAEALVSFTNRIKTVALKATNGTDWAVFGDKPYLLETGVKNVLQIVGASVFDVQMDEEIRHEDDGRKVGYFTAIGKISFMGRVHVNVGTGTTKDKFFAKRKDAQGGEKELTYDEVDIQNVRKKAVTNLQHRLLDMVLKLRPTLDELKALGIEPKGKVDFAKGSQGGTTDTADEKTLRAELKTLVARAANVLDRKPEDVLRDATAFGEGPTAFAGYFNVDKVSAKMLKKAITSIKNRLEKEDGPAADKPAAAQGAQEGAKK